MDIGDHTNTDRCRTLSLSEWCKGSPNSLPLERCICDCVPACREQGKVVRSTRRASFLVDRPLSGQGPTGVGVCCNVVAIFQGEGELLSK
jgi:hypothetical protein